MLAISVVSGTLAYFTDTDADNNVFTIGSVDIELLESQYHREVDHVTDEEIIDDAEVIYFYKKPVSAGGDTARLFKQFQQKPNANQPDGYELVIEVLGSGIQSTPIHVVEDHWGVTLENGNITGVN